MKRALILLALISSISCDSFESGDPVKMQIVGQQYRILQEDAPETTDKKEEVKDKKVEPKVEIKVEEVDNEAAKYGVFNGKRWERKFNMSD